MKIMYKLLIIVIMALTGCSAKYVPEIKQHSNEVWGNAGYKVIGYEGYLYTPPGGRWGGAVWYIVRREPDTGVTYHGCISKWRDEYHIYDLSAIDAIGPK